MKVKNKIGRKREIGAIKDNSGKYKKNLKLINIFREMRKIFIFMK